MNDKLEEIYYNPLTGYTGINQLKRAFKEKTGKSITHKELTTWLQKELAYTLHKPIRRSFPTSRVYVHHIDEQWQADIAEMIPYSNVNEGCKYIFTVIVDVFSKYAWAVALKTKQGKETVQAFQSIFSSSGRIPQKFA